MIYYQAFSELSHSRAGEERIRNIIDPTNAVADDESLKYTSYYSN